MATLIERQDRHVAALEPIYRDRFARGWMGQDLCGRRARLNRKHVEELRAAGYSQREAAQSASDCCDMAALNARAE